ncbi:MAG TPA: NAD(P)/FAD-dependent oxidoreductase [Candidatus Deferrimicrobium sp.]|nr:NAD(P)/FAD-dependent oxidoreductase [Candidatus Deferrimicrobium sp.]
MADRYDAVVIGAGPNGLAAAITLAQAGRSVVIYEAEAIPGGGASSRELTLPGYVHDVCSTVYPLAIGSPFFRTLPLEQHGLQWIHPPAPLAHPLDDGTAVIVERSIDATAANLAGDAGCYRRLMNYFCARWDGLAVDLLGPPRLPHGPCALARFGLLGIRPAANFAHSYFKGVRARALFAGLAAHSMLPLESLGSAAFGLVLAIAAHSVGWPVARGGAQNLTAALTSYARALGVAIITRRRIVALSELPKARAVLCDVTPRQLLALAGNGLPHRFQRRLQNYRYGMGVYKVDWALSAPVPWRAAECARAATVHVAGTLEEIAWSERAAWRGEQSARPFVLIAQPSLFDASRAPPGKHTLWGYCHVPHGSKQSMLDSIENQIERFAPGFRDIVLARHMMGPALLEQRNANLVGGDINGGSADLRQLFLRPSWRMYGTPVRGLYLCSASTPPGGGVHGMCGYFAARQALSEME